MDHRRGSALKLLGIVVAVLVLVAGGVFLYARQKLAAEFGKPLDIPDAATRQEVISSLKRRIQQTAHVVPGASEKGVPPGTSPDTITIVGDEVTLLITRLLPAVEGMKVGVDIAEGVADVKLSMPGAEAKKRAGDALGPLAAADVPWLNVHARGTLKVVQGKISFEVKQVVAPTFVQPAQLQGLIEGVLRSTPPGPVKVPLGDYSFLLSDLELDGNVAILKVFRLPPDGKP